METLIEFKSVSTHYKKKKVIDDLSFSLKKGEVIALLGPSGCGKTTILNVTAGLLKETSGKVHVHTKKMGYVFQEHRLLPWKTVIDNILFVINDDDKKRKYEKAMRTLKMVGLDHVSDYFPAQLSGGMKQRVSIARAFAINPAMILMDEPFSAIDTELKSDLQNDLMELINNHSTGILYVTHDPLEAIKLADRILILSCENCNIKYEMVIDQARQNRGMNFLKETELQLRNCLGGLR